MFKLFREFFSFIIQNLEEFVIQNDPLDDEMLELIFAIYTLIKRMGRVMDSFVGTLKVWQRDFYHGSTWSAAHFHLSKIKTVMGLIGDDLNTLIQTQNPELNWEKKSLLSYKFRGDSCQSRIDTFDIWMGIIEKNIINRFCGWISHYSETQGKTLDAFGEIKFFPNVERRTLFLPNHSLLLPQITRTSELDDLSQSRWVRQIDLMLYFRQPHEDQTNILNFLPEFPPIFPITMKGDTSLRENYYALMIEVPEQEQIMIEIITSIEQEVSDFHHSITQLKNTLENIFKERLEILF